jgi:hypothetical protein
MKDNKKVIAAIAAVMDYIRMEQDALRLQAAEFGIPAAPVAPLPPAAVNRWGLNGRQVQMQMRNLMQLRIFQKI